MALPINVGFVGLSATGWAASALGPALVQDSLHDKYKLVAVSTTSAASAKASAEKYGKQTGNVVKAYHGDSSKIAADPDVDLVAVSVKAPLHKQVVLPIIDAGKPFFVEWPAGTGLKETLEIAEAARNKGVRSLVGLQARNSAVVQKVKELLSKGVIGTIHSTTFIASVQRETYTWPPEVKAANTYTIDRNNGVTLLSIAVGHQLDAFTHVLGSFATISATATTRYSAATIVDQDGKSTGQTIPATNPDHYNISGLLQSGAIATLIFRSGYAAAQGRRRLLWEIEGEEGSIRLESESAFMNVHNPTIYLNGEKVEVEGAESQLSGILGAAWEEYAKGPEGSYATIEDAVKNHRILDAVERSIAEGKVVVL